MNFEEEDYKLDDEVRLQKYRNTQIWRLGRYCLKRGVIIEYEEDQNLYLNDHGMYILIKNKKELKHVIVGEVWLIS